MQQKLTNCPTCSKLSTLKSVTVNGERIKGCVKCLSKLKDSVLKEKRKIAREKKSAARKISKEAILTDMQLLSRLLGKNTCCTCGTKFDNGKHKANGGHFRKRDLNNTASLIENITAQCAWCNSPFGGKGEEWKHGIYLDSFWGNGTAEKLHKMSMAPYKITKDIYMDMREKIDEWLILANKPGLTNDEKIVILFSIRDWQQDQYWYKEILSKTKT